MRAYFLTNMYLSSIQHGIQAAHCLQEINNKYQDPTDEHLQLLEWATDHKTIIVLNGGTSEYMDYLLQLFNHKSNNFPWAYFNEPSIHNALTCIGIIVPDSVYEFRRSEYGTFQHELSELLTTRHFAR